MDTATAELSPNLSEGNGYPAKDQVKDARTLRGYIGDVLHEWCDMIGPQTPSEGSTLLLCHALGSDDGGDIHDLMTLGIRKYDLFSRLVICFDADLLQERVYVCDRYPKLGSRRWTLESASQ